MLYKKKNWDWLLSKVTPHAKFKLLQERSWNQRTQSATHSQECSYFLIKVQFFKNNRIVTIFWNEIGNKHGNMFYLTEIALVISRQSI